jgi:hypothetical protein
MPKATRERAASEPRDNAPMPLAPAHGGLQPDMAKILDLDPEQRQAAKVYVMGASVEYQRAREVIDAIGADRVTHDWPRALVEQEIPDHGLSRTQCASAALLCLKQGVDRCDVAVALIPQYGNVSTGLWTELGYAIKAGKVLYTVGSRQGIFWSLRDRSFSTDAQLIAFLQGKVSA